MLLFENSDKFMTDYSSPYLDLAGSLTQYSQV